MSHEQGKELLNEDWWEVTSAELHDAQAAAAQAARCHGAAGAPCGRSHACTGAIHVIDFARTFRKTESIESMRRTCLVAFGALVARKYRSAQARQVQSARMGRGGAREHFALALLEDLADDLEGIMRLHGLNEPVLELQRCRVCRCTNNRSCGVGCSWVTDDLCSRCQESQS